MAAERTTVSRIERFVVTVRCERSVVFLPDAHHTTAARVIQESPWSSGVNSADLLITDVTGGALVSWDLDADTVADGEILVENVLASALTTDVFEFV